MRNILLPFPIRKRIQPGALADLFIHGDIGIGSFEDAIMNCPTPSPYASRERGLSKGRRVVQF